MMIGMYDLLSWWKMVLVRDNNVNLRGREPVPRLRKSRLKLPKLPRKIFKWGRVACQVVWICESLNEVISGFDFDTACGCLLF